MGLQNSNSSQIHFKKPQKPYYQGYVGLKKPTKPSLLSFLLIWTSMAFKSSIFFIFPFKVVVHFYTTYYLKKKKTNKKKNSSNTLCFLIEIFVFLHKGFEIIPLQIYINWFVFGITYFH